MATKKELAKADPYLHHRDEVAAIIGDEQYLFDSVEIPPQPPIEKEKKQC